jgi:hypothetical protein
VTTNSGPAITPAPRSSRVAERVGAVVVAVVMMASSRVSRCGHLPVDRIAPFSTRGPQTPQKILVTTVENDDGRST